MVIFKGFPTEYEAFLKKVMEIDKWYPERGTNIFENDFSNFYFLKVDISLTLQDPDLKLYIYVTNIAVEGIMSQNFDRGPSSFYKKSRKIFK